MKGPDNVIEHTRVVDMRICIVDQAEPWTPWRGAAKPHCIIPHRAGISSADTAAAWALMLHVKAKHQLPSMYRKVLGVLQHVHLKQVQEQEMHVKKLSR